MPSLLKLPPSAAVSAESFADLEDCGSCILPDLSEGMVNPSSNTATPATDASLRLRVPEEVTIREKNDLIRALRLIIRMAENRGIAITSVCELIQSEIDRAKANPINPPEITEEVLLSIEKRNQEIRQMFGMGLIKLFRD